MVPNNITGLGSFSGLGSFTALSPDKNAYYGLFSTTVYKFSMGADTSSTLSATNPNGASAVAAFSNNGSAGYTQGGNPTIYDTGVKAITKYLYSNDTTSTLTNASWISSYGGAGITNSGTAGYLMGGIRTDAGSTGSISKMPYSNETPANIGATISFGVAPRGNAGLNRGGVAGYSVNGDDGGHQQFSSKLTYSNDTTSGSFTPTQATINSFCVSDGATTGYIALGSNNGTVRTTLNKVVFSTETVSTPAAVLSQARAGGFGISLNGVAGYFFMGRSTSVPTSSNVIDKLNFSTETMSVVSPSASASGPASINAESRAYGVGDN